MTDGYWVEPAVWMVYPQEEMISNEVGKDPYGIAIGKDGFFYVSEEGRRYDVPGRIVKLDPSGNRILSWGEEELRQAQGVAVGPDGYIYVADSRDFKIKKFTDTGELVAESDPITWIWPYGVGVAGDSNGNVYATVSGWRDDLLIWKFDKDLNYVDSFGKVGSGDGEFDVPMGITVDNEGNLIVVDTNNERVQKITPEGEFIMKWGELGPDPGEFGWPFDVAIDSKGDIYVLDAGYEPRVQKFRITVPLEGEITTPLINFPDLFSYIGIVSTEEITISTAQSISYEYSTDGNSWYDVPADGIVMEADTDTKDIQFRVTLKRKEGYDSPALDKVVVEYVDWGSGSSGNSVQSGGGSVVGAMSAAGALDEDAEDKFKAGEVYVFPNPAKQTEPTFRLEYTNADRVELAVYNIAAELIYAKEVNSPPEIYEYTLNTRDIPSGVYVYVVRAIKGNMEMDRKMKKFALIK